MSPKKWYYKEIDIDEKELAKAMKKDRLKFDDCFKCEEDIKL